MEHLSIERARLADRDAIIRLLAAQMSEHRMQTGHQGLHRVVDQLLAGEQYGFILVGRLRREVVAVAYVAIIFSVEHGARVGWLEELYVTPEEREAGVGSAMLNRVIKLAHQQGLAALDLEVEAEHRRAESLYARFGFRQLPRSRWVKDRLAGKDPAT